MQMIKLHVQLVTLTRPIMQKSMRRHLPVCSRDCNCHRLDIARVGRDMAPFAYVRDVGGEDQSSRAAFNPHFLVRAWHRHVDESAQEGYPSKPYVSAQEASKK